MGIKEKIPLINSNSKMVRIVGYVFSFFVALAILGAVSPPEDAGPSVAVATEAPAEQCMEPSEFSIQSEDALMQMGYFKKVDFMTSEGERIKITAEPSELAYQGDTEIFMGFLHAAVGLAPACLGIKTVEIIVKLPDYNVVERYPFSAATNGTEAQDGSREIEQR
jgi:hypothetical protein